MKLIKNNLKFVIVIIITCLFSGMSAIYATYMYYANDVNFIPSDEKFEVTNVKEALDYLYDNQKTYEYYRGNYDVTPTFDKQTLSTNNKILTKDITINAIPSSYKILSSTTTAENNNILDGYTAYNSNGDLLTGTISTNCVSGSYTKAANANVSIDFGLVPSFYMFNVSTGVGRVTILYNKKEDSNVKVIRHYNNTADDWNYVNLSGTKITTTLGSASPLYQKSQEITYMACA